MAHKGQLYRLAFRRDLSLQIENNRFGWPAKFRVTCLFCAGGVGGGCNLIPFDVPISTPPGSKNIIGSSPAVFIGGRAIHVEIFATPAGFPEEYPVVQAKYMEFAIIHAIFEGPQVFTDRLSNWAGGGATTVVRQNPPLFVATQGQAQCTINAVHYYEE